MPHERHDPRCVRRNHPHRRRAVIGDASDDALGRRSRSRASSLVRRQRDRKRNRRRPLRRHQPIRQASTVVPDQERGQPGLPELPLRMRPNVLKGRRLRRLSLLRDGYATGPVSCRTRSVVYDVRNGQPLRPHYPAGPVARGGCGRHKHTGPVNGAQVVQVSISQDSPLIRRPQKELKRFRKGFRRAGETQRVTVTMAKKHATSFFHGTRNQWVSEQGSYTVLVGEDKSEEHFLHLIGRRGGQVC